MPKPACAKCQRFFRPKKNGVRVLEGKPLINEAQPGTLQAGLWSPYKLWMADLWHCEGCGAEIVVGYGTGPLAQDFQPSFKSEVDAARENAEEFVRVNDC